MMDISEKIVLATVDILTEDFDHPIHRDEVQIDATRKEFEGDYTVVVFPFLRALKMKPEEAGNALGSKLLAAVEEVESFNVIKGFLNLKLSSAYWGDCLKDLIEDKQWFQASDDGELVLVEYSSPNTNKPLHLGHLRNNFLGHSVSLIKAFNGDEVIKTQIVNDRGVHICKSMLAWKMHGKGETPESTGMKGDKLVGKYYVLFDEHLRAQVNELVAKGVEQDEAVKQAPLTQMVQDMLRKWEQGDPETVELWKMMNQWVYDGFDTTYDRMGVEFDTLYYESDTYTKGKDIVLKGLEDGLFFTKGDGSVWVDLEDKGLDQKLLLRADGTTVYMTQDIGTAVQRYEDYPKMAQAIYTVGDEQDYHFKVLFLILEKLGYKWAPACRHLSYGMVDLPSGKMKSREGTVVDADELMEEVVAAARQSSEEKGKLDEMSEEEQQALFEMLGIGALKFYLLRVDPKKRMMFNPEESVSLQGDTGPFVQYTHARCKAVLRKTEAFTPSTPEHIEEKEALLLRELTQFRTVAKSAAEAQDPSAIASYCIDVAKLYNQFYHDVPILTAEGKARDFRLGLTQLTADTLATAMGLLGIQVPERM